MDIDVLRVSGKAEWKRLDELTRTRNLSGEDIDELDRLYRSATTDLARVRTSSPDPDLIADLSRTLSAARGRLAGTGGLTGAAIARFFRVSLPLTLYQIRWGTLAVAAVFVVLGAIQAHYLMTTPDAMNELGTPEQLRNYAHTSFVEYYHQDTHAEFGLSVWANNAWIALQAVATGITGVYPLMILWRNATGVGDAAGIVITYGGPWHFFRFILPHGLPELTAVFISVAAGLRRGDALPGRRSCRPLVNDRSGWLRDSPRRIGRPGGLCDALAASRRRQDLPGGHHDGSRVGLHADPRPTGTRRGGERGRRSRLRLLSAGRRLIERRGWRLQAPALLQLNVTVGGARG